MPRQRQVLIAMALVLVAAACGGGGDTQAGPPVPDLPFETFDGQRTNLAAFEGQPLVVNFWASWCPPCVAEMPEFERVHLARHDEVRFIGLNTQDNLADAEALVELTGVTYDLGLDPDGELFRQFEVIAMPSTYFVGDDGVIVHDHAGILNEQQLHDLIDEHLVDGDGED